MGMTKAMNAWKNLKEQRNDHHVVSIVSVMFEVTNDAQYKLAELDQIIAGDTKTFDIKKLIPSNSAYYTYQGSLTTPNCDSNVDWIVLKKPLKISTSQLLQLVNLQKGINEGFVSNSRPTQVNTNYVYSCDDAAMT